MTTREHILAEIRRLANLEGKAPGRRSFTAATGIKEGEWAGVHWARWNDAVRDAGIEPNSATQRINENELLQSYAELVRRLKKLPSQMEIRLAGRSGDFPSDSAFRKRFRTKDATIEALRIWLQDNKDFQDIESYIPIREEHPFEDEKISEGWVYLLKSDSNYKIGQSKNLEQRVKQLSTNYPEALELVHAIRTDDPSGIERYWHKRFQEVRTRSNAEWFKLTTNQVRAFKRRKFQ